jgi:hypothetical protein
MARHSIGSWVSHIKGESRVGTVKALQILTDEATPARVIDVETDLESVRAAIGGGWLEAVDIGRGWHAYVDEEGKLKRLPINRRASALAWFLGWPTTDALCGPAIFLGSGDNGEEADVPPGIVDLLGKLGGEES